MSRTKVKRDDVTLERIENMGEALEAAAEVFAQLAAGTYTGRRRDIIAAGDRVKMMIYDIDTVAWWHDDSKGDA